MPKHLCNIPSLAQSLAMNNMADLPQQYRSRSRQRSAATMCISGVQKKERAKSDEKAKKPAGVRTSSADPWEEMGTAPFRPPMASALARLWCALPAMCRAMWSADVVVMSHSLHTWGERLAIRPSATSALLRCFLPAICACTADGKKCSRAAHRGYSVFESWR